MTTDAGAPPRPKALDAIVAAVAAVTLTNDQQGTFQLDERNAENLAARAPSRRLGMAAQADTDAQRRAMPVLSAEQWQELRGSERIVLVDGSCQRRRPSHDRGRGARRRAPHHQRHHAGVRRPARPPQPAPSLPGR